MKRGFSRQLFDDLRERRYNVARNKQAGADPDRLKRATFFVVATFPVLSLIALLASYAAVYAARVEQGGKWSRESPSHIRSPRLDYFGWEYMAIIMNPT